MRRLSVLTAVALLAGTAFAGGVDVTDPPDIRLSQGASATGVFDLADYFASSDIAPGAGAASPVDVAGSADVGLTSIDVASSDGSVTATIHRKVSSFMLSGGPGPSDNLTLVGQEVGSNLFINCLRAGVAVNSSVPLTGGPAGGGGGGTPGGGSPGNGSPGAGGAAWMVTFSSISCDVASSGLLTRSVAVTAGPSADSLSAGGLTASIDAAGNYTLVSDASFAGPVLVTFNKQAGSDMDSASVLASAGVDAGNNYAVNGMDAGTTLIGASDIVSGQAFTGYTFGAAIGDPIPGQTDGVGLLVDAPAGSVLQLFLPPVAVGSGPQTVSIGYGGDLGVSLAVMDNGVLTAGNQDLSYIVNLGPGEVDPGTLRRLSVTYEPPTGSLVPVIQIVGGAGGQAAFDNLWICAADSDLCNAPGREYADLVSLTSGAGFDGGFSSLDGVINNINSQDHNDATIVDGAAQLAAGGGNLSNITLGYNVQGPVVLRLGCMAQLASSGGLGSQFGVLALVGGGQTSAGGGSVNFGTFVSASTLAGGAWQSVESVAPVQSSAVPGPITVTVQAAIAAVGLGAGDTFVVNVDNLNVSVVDDAPEFFDAAAIGM